MARAYSLGLRAIAWLTVACGSSAHPSTTRISDGPAMPEAGLDAKGGDDARVPDAIAPADSPTPGRSGIAPQADAPTTPEACIPATQEIEVTGANPACAFELSDELERLVRAYPGAINLYVDPTHRVADSGPWPDCTRAVWVEGSDTCDSGAGHFAVYLADTGGSATVHVCPETCATLAAIEQNVFLLQHVRADLGCSACICFGECL